MNNKNIVQNYAPVNNTNTKNKPTCSIEDNPKLNYKPSHDDTKKFLEQSFLCCLKRLKNGTKSSCGSHKKSLSISKKLKMENAPQSRKSSIGCTGIRGSKRRETPSVKVICLTSQSMELHNV